MPRASYKHYSIALENLRQKLKQLHCVSEYSLLCRKSGSRPRCQKTDKSRSGQKQPNNLQESEEGGRTLPYNKELKKRARQTRGLGVTIAGSGKHRQTSC